MGKERWRARERERGELNEVKMCICIDRWPVTGGGRVGGEGEQRRRNKDGGRERENQVKSKRVFV